MVPIRAFESGGKVLVQAKNLHKQKWNELVFNCTVSQFKAGIEAYGLGAHIQNAFPFLSDDEREFLLSGITPDEWTAMFGKEPE